MRVRVLTAAAVVLVACAAIARAQPAPPSDGAPRMAMAEFKKLLAEDKIVVIDVRGFESYKAGHIPGARSVPLDQLNLKAEELKAVGKPIVAYCA